ncbi:MAG: type II toxin-antitoxin system VapC family toxin [Leptospira sp.]|nr:type II toxin-antitoxin system VapC family toxin [Leptospira sp.]
MIDSNIIIYASKGMINFSEIFDSETILSISIVSYIETLGYDFKIDREKEMIERFINNMKVIYIDSYIAEKTIEIRRKHKIALPDAIIAATAIIHDLTFVTKNISDFEKITDLNLEKLSKPL